MYTNVLFKPQTYLLLAMDMAKVGGCEGFHTKFEHPKSTPYYFSLPLILSVK